MSLFHRVKSILDEIKFSTKMDTWDVDWCYHFDHEDTVSWIEDGEIYSAETSSGSSNQEDCVFIDIYDDCGGTVTLVFKKDRKMNYDDFYDKYEEYM